jgi:thiosulfate/3-mercaptopyruvate sulfurtransferase
MHPTTASTSSALVGVARLRELLDSGETVTLLDVRWSLEGPPGHRFYAQGHLPGAVYVDLDQDLSDPGGPRGRHPLPDPERFAAAMRTAGVGRYDPVVVYDQNDGSAAARAWWLLRYHGHEDVRLLDGGYEAWRDAGGPVTSEEIKPRVGDFVAVPGAMPVLDAAGAAALADHGVLLDARAADRYRGEREPVDPVAGHIPGAVSAPTDGNVSANGIFQAPEQLRSRFAGLGVADSDADIGVYCGSGVTAAHEVLALHLIGIEAALYPGSWSEWITDPDRPVASGPAEGDPA